MVRKSLKMKLRLSSLWTSIKSPFKRRNNIDNFLGNFNFADSNFCQTYDESSLAEETLDSYPLPANLEPVPSDPEPTTMDTFIDDCLVPILAHLPFTEQMINIPLTCSRWNNLLQRVHQQRSQLVIWNTLECPPESGICPQLFNHPLPEEALPYTDYLTHLFNDSDRAHMTTLNPDFAIQNRPIEAHMCTQLGVSFPNLTDLSLVEVGICPITLSHFLDHFRIKLRSLSLISVDILFPEETSSVQLALLHRILAVINSMASLTRLALTSFPWHSCPHPDLSNELATVLPNLIEFDLVEHENNVLPILKRLDENKMRRLNLRGTVWSDAGMFSRLVATKPALGENLTHLTVGVFEYTSGEAIDYQSVAHLRILERIVKAFPQLVYFHFFTKNTLSDMLPHLGKLKQLVTLKLCSPGWGLFAVPLAGWSRRQLTTNSLKSVKSLTLSCCYLTLLDDLPPIRALFPKLEKLYLDRSQFRCTCPQEEEGEVDEDEEDEEEENNLEGQMEAEDQADNQVVNQVEDEADLEEEDVNEEDQEEEGEGEIHDEEEDAPDEEEPEVSRFIKLPAQQAAGCVCKVRLLAQLAKFNNLSQMSVNYAFSKKSQQSN